MTANGPPQAISDIKAEREGKKQKSLFEVEQKAAALYRQGNFDEAYAHYYAALRDRPKDVNLLIILGDILVEKNDEDGALDFYDRAIEIDQNNLRARSARGNLHLLMLSDDEALEDFNAILEIKPNDVATLVDKGFALESLGDYKKALESYNKAKELDPKNLEAIKRIKEVEERMPKQPLCGCLVQ